MNRDTKVELIKLGIRAAAVVGSFAIMHNIIKDVTKEANGILKGCIGVAELIFGVSLSDSVGQTSDKMVDDVVATYSRYESAAHVE